MKLFQLIELLQVKANTAPNTPETEVEYIIIEEKQGSILCMNFTQRWGIKIAKTLKNLFDR